MRNEIGMNIHEVSTPAVVVDLDVVERNLTRMSSYCHSHQLGLRPHTKTHKSIEAAMIQLQLGAIGLTVAKVGEAEVMRASGTKEILVAHPIVGRAKIERLAALAKELRIIIAVDSLRAAEELARVACKEGVTFDVLVEFDSGSQRCGVAAGKEAKTLGEQIGKLEGTRLSGLFTYFGNVWGDEAERAAELNKARADVAMTLEAYRAAGLSTEIVSAGSTPAARMSHTVEGITEIRPGTYIYNDLNTYYQGLCSLDDCAVRVVTTVVSTAVPGHAIVDAGSKTLSSDLCSAGPKSGYGLLVEREGTLKKLNEEHGYLQANSLKGVDVGQVFSLIPNHVCTCINMHDEVLTARKGVITGSWRVAARGKVC